MFLIRWLLGRLILGLNALFVPKTIERAPEAQARLDQATSRMSIYEFETCPFCVRVRRSLKRLGIKMELKDARRNQTYAQELVREGGMHQVPCLRIVETNGSVRWMYESSDIIKYLKELSSEPLA